MASIQEIPEDIQAWLRTQIGVATAFHKLSGGVTTTLYRVESAQGDLVLRLFDNARWLREEPDLAVHEAAALQRAATLSIPSPELIAYDDREACSIPVLLMTVLPGEIRIAPDDLESWLHEIARTLATIHAPENSDFGWQHERWFSLEDFAPPVWSDHPQLWQRAYEIISAAPPKTDQRFIHRDYHPMNFLWRDGVICGVVDWVNGCIGSVGVDVAHCRNNLVCLHGVGAANRFLATYEELTGRVQQPYWDLVGFFEFFYTQKLGVYTPWLEFGMPHLTPQDLCKKADAYLVDILAKC